MPGRRRGIRPRRADPGRLPGFNMKMARWAKEHGIRTFYYIAPKVWAWREWRVKAIRRWVDRLFVIFPFECGYFPRHGVEPIFEGNPLVDAIEARRTSLPRRRVPPPARARPQAIIALLAAAAGRDPRQPAADGRLSRKFPGTVRRGGRGMARPLALRTVYGRQRHPVTSATRPTRRSPRPKPPW